MGRRPLLLALLLSVLAAEPAAARPQRIVSLDLCTDQLVLALAAPEQIAAVSWLARDCTLSGRCEQAAGVPAHHGTGEELVAAEADLVVVGRHAARGALAVARARGLPVLELDSPVTLDGIGEQIMRLGNALGQPARAAALMASFEQRLKDLPAPPPPPLRPLAALYQAHGTTIGPGTLVDSVFRRAGLANLADGADTAARGYLPLEELVWRAPDLLVVEQEGADPPSLAEGMLRHPALLASFGPARRAVVPQRLWICAGPDVALAVERLVAARLALGEPDGAR